MSDDEMSPSVEDWEDDSYVDDDEWDDDELVEDQTVEPTDVHDGDIDPDLVAAVDAIRPCWAEAVARHIEAHGRCDPTEFAAGTGILARVGRGTGLGRYETRERKNGLTYEQWVRITDWVGYRSRQRTTYTIGPDHRLGQTGVITHTVVLLDRRGRRWGIHDVPSDTSASARMVDAAAADLEVPFPPKYRHAIANMFRLLAADEMEVVSEVASTGWCLGLTPEHPARPTYLAPLGSITSDGVTAAHRVSAPVGSTGALSGIMSQVGFGGVDAPPDQAIAGVELFGAITPHRLDIPVALLGALWSSPLGLPSRPVVMVEGTTDSGKTILCTALMSFVAHVQPGAKDAATMSFRATTEAGARSRLGWHRDMLAFIDDYRRDEDDKRTNETMDAILSLVTQAGYGAPVAAKSTQTGGTRAVPDIRATVVISGEVAAHDQAIRNRTVVVHVGLEDHITERGGGFDHFRDSAGALPRALMADYLRWLCERVEAHADEPGGGLVHMMRTAAADARSWYTSHSGRRAAETVSGLAAGWTMFRRYARARGLLDHIPSESEVEAALVALADSQLGDDSSVDPGLRVLATIRDAVASAQGHFLSPNNERPNLDGCGWVREVSSSLDRETVRWAPKGQALGILADTHEYVIVTRAHIASAMRLANMTGLRPEQVHRALAEHHETNTEPGTRCSAQLVATRPKGWVIPAHMLGIGSTPNESTDDTDPDHIESDEV